jgi:hypothetical protein
VQQRRQRQQLQAADAGPALRSTTTAGLTILIRKRSSTCSLGELLSLHNIQHLMLLSVGLGLLGSACAVGNVFLLDAGVS